MVERSERLTDDTTASGVDIDILLHDLGLHVLSLIHAIGKVAECVREKPKGYTPNKVVETTEVVDIDISEPDGKKARDVESGKEALPADTVIVLTRNNNEIP